MRIGLIITAIASVIGFILMGSYHTEAHFLFYRLAFNLNQGHGIVYNAGESTLLTLSPLAVLPIGILPQSADVITAILSIIGIGTSAGLLYPLLKEHGFTPNQALSIIGIWFISWTTWTGFRSTDAIVFASVLLSLHLLNKDRFSLAGGLIGITVLYQTQAIIPLIILGIYYASRRYWQFALLPIVLWSILAWWIYDAIMLPFDFAAAEWQDGVWLILFVVAVVLLRQQSIPRIWWIFPLWGALYVLSTLALSGNIMQISSLPISLTIAISLTLISTSITQYGIIAAGLCLLVIFPPQTPNFIQADLEARELLPAKTSIAHTRSDAFAYDFTGNVYRLDGEHSPQIASFIQRDDLASVIALTSPDYLFLDHSIDLTQPGLEALNYISLDDQLWERQSTIQAFDTPIQTNINYGPEVKLTGYQIDHQRLTPGGVMRLNLDWELIQPPEDYDVTLNISLLDVTTQTPIVTIFPSISGHTWQALRLSTVHALTLPDDIQPGLYDISVTVDYRAGILGRHNIGNIIAPFTDLTVTQAYGTLGGIALYDFIAEQADNTLNLTFNWVAEDPTDRPYSIFLHLSPIDDLAPVRQADGAPLGGRYPTTHWYTGDVIQETRQIDLSDLTPGEYRINIGFYADDGTRLAGESGDFISPIRLTLTNDGEVITAPFE